MKIYLFIIGLLFLPEYLCAQIISGKVTNKNKEPLGFALIYSEETKEVVYTDEKGEYRLDMKQAKNKNIIASIVGYKTDTINAENKTVVNFILQSTGDLDEIIVKGEQDGIVISNIDPIKTERINAVELKKAACCDLAGCFETQLTVQPQTTNVITNSKELRILGLSGVYNQILIDGFPAIQGLAYTYGISSIPGTSVSNIYVSKGANSVLQGFESMSGQINVITKEPNSKDKLLLNAYMNSFLEKHFNANILIKDKKWKSLLTLHSVQPAKIIDKDKDQFMDIPLLTRYMVANKWKYGKESNWGWNSIINFKYLNEKRIGGQTFYETEKHKGSTEIYGQTVQISQPEISARVGYRLNDKSNFLLQASSFIQNQQSYFGTINYKAEQQNVYANLQYELNYNKKNSLKSGLSFRHLNLKENIGFTDTSLKRTYGGNYLKNENIAGVFAENTMHFFDNRITWMAGVRGDQHNQFGFTVTPRTLIKVDVSKNTSIRANVGTGWRTINLFSENIGLLVSSRNIIIAEQLRPERAVNSGINITRKFDNKKISGYISADFYNTSFQNQIFPDYDANPQEAIIRNFEGNSVSNGFQVEAFVKLSENIEFKSGYSYLDVYRVINGSKVVLPFNPKDKVMAAVSYISANKKYQIDVNAHYFGIQKLPNTSSNPEEFQRAGYSDPYTIVNMQVMYKIKKTEIYGGCENIFNFRQNKPIISWQNPFSPYFDTSSVWGSTRGRELYLGVRFYLQDS